MESKFSGRVLAHVVFMLRSSDRVVQQRAAMALARMAPEADLRAIFVDKRGLDVLLDMLVDEALEQRMQVRSRWCILGGGMAARVLVIWWGSWWGETQASPGGGGRGRRQNPSDTCCGDVWGGRLGGGGAVEGLPCFCAAEVLP